MLFIREIKYFDYMEAGYKVGHVGHARIELWERDGILLYDAEDGGIHIRISNLPGNYVGRAHVMLLTTMGTFHMGEIDLSGGGGTFVYAQSKLTEEIDGNLAYDRILGIKINLGQQKEAFCRIHEVPESTYETEKEEKIAIEVANSINTELAENEDSMQISGVSETEDMTENQAVPPKWEEAEENVKNVRDEAEVEAHEENNTIQAAGRIVQQEAAPMGEDKWSHLCNIYPRITPFSDDREYLQIGPGDFVLLSSKYYTLINNSFMLHGYYHYGQLVLCRVQKRGKSVYYLGTPGIYLEREKQVAIMYGFETFECAAEPATEGDFGYYMVQVEL